MARHRWWPRTGPAARSTPAPHCCAPQGLATALARTLRAIRPAWPLLALASACLAGAAQAQVAASVSLQSDQQYRGHSLSDRRPIVGVTLAYDDDSGLYGGVAATTTAAHEGLGYGLGVVDYLGYARRLGAGPTLDLGVTDANVISYKFPKHHRVDYQEAYVGLIGGNLSVHAHYSPNYFHTGIQTLYVDVDGAIRPTPEWRLFGHVGALTPVGGPELPGSRKEHYDVSAGLARRFAHTELSFTWSSTGPVPNLPDGKPQDRDAFVLSASYFF
jgi:uncharacterized protein (TIGR02001 family)